VARADLTRMENGPAKSVRIASPIHYGAALTAPASTSAWVVDSAPTATIAHT
jgi:hypothetical protein